MAPQVGSARGQIRVMMIDEGWRERLGLGLSDLRLRHRGHALRGSEEIALRGKVRCSETARDQSLPEARCSQ